jgi:hypothetical protein
LYFAKIFTFVIVEFNEAFDNSVFIVTQLFLTGRFRTRPARREAAAVVKLLNVGASDSSSEKLKRRPREFARKTK